MDPKYSCHPYGTTPARNRGEQGSRTTSSGQKMENMWRKYEKIMRKSCSSYFSHRIHVCYIWWHLPMDPMGLVLIHWNWVPLKFRTKPSLFKGPQRCAAMIFKRCNGFHVPNWICWPTYWSFPQSLNYKYLPQNKRVQHCIATCLAILSEKWLYTLW